MRSIIIKSIILLCLAVFYSPMALACFGLSAGQSCPRDCGKKGEECCGRMGGISYCDSSAGRYVCQNGDYSACYCTRHGVMNFQHIQGCCMWQGGVRHTNSNGKVICANGEEAEICNLVDEMKPRSTF